MRNRHIAKRSLLVFGIIYCIFVTTVDLAAQTSLGTSSVGGEVRDASGSVIQDARVELADLEHNVSRVTRTNGTGNYLMPGVSAGFYSLTFSKDGFKEYIVSNFRIIIDQSVTVNATLDVGTVSQSVKVTENSEALLLDTVSNVFGTVLDSARVENLPLNGRNFMQLGFMAAGTAVPTSNADLAVAQYGHQDRAIMIGGNGEGLTSYMVDGIETRGARIGESGLNLSLADIDEFKVNVSFFMADQGPDPGIINLYTKSGSNQLHGQVFEYVRNGDFNARNFFAPKPEPLHRNQFGFDLGGPIAIPHVINGRDKLWFHAYYEGQRQVEALSQSAFTPDAKMFGGDLSEVPQQIYNPFSVDPVTGLRQPFPNNQIPAAMINPVSQKLLAYYLPGSSYAQTPSNLFVNPSDKLTDNQFGGRVDAALSSRQNLFVNFIWQNSPALNDGIMPYTGAEYPADAQLAVMQHTFTFNPGLINVARIGFSRDFAFHRGQPSTSATLAEQLGIDNTFDPSGIPLMAIQGFSSFGTTVGKIGNVDDNYQLDESLNYIHGKHAFAFGGGIRYHRTEQLNNNGDARGNLNFVGSFTAQLMADGTGPLVPVPNTGNGFADFLLGLPLNGITSGLPPIFYHFTQWMPYFQDTWKVTPSFTLNYGTSWYYASVPNPQGTARNQVAAFNFKTGLLEYSALGQVSPQLIKPEYNSFTPRFGFAWQPWFWKNTVIRSGVGSYLSDQRLIEAQNAFESPPFGAPYTFSSSSNTPFYILGQNVFQVIPLPPLNDSFAADLPPGSFPNILSVTNRTPYVAQWNFTIQHTFGASNLVEVAYLGSQGHKLENRYDADQCVPDPSLLCDPATRPYPQYAGLLIFDNDGNSNYNALVVKYNHQFSRGLTVLAEYTYSKTIMDSWEGDGTDSQIATCRKCDRGPASFSFPQSLYISTVYDLPFGRGLRFGSDWSKAADLFLGGWRITGITSFVSGDSFSITAPNTTSSLFSGVKADRLCDGADSSDRHSLRSNGGVFFDTSCFALPLPAHFGNSGRGIFVGPGVNNWDLGLEKDFALYERFRMQLRGEFFNAFNHAQFEDPGSTVGGVNFGVVTTARAPREIQLAAKFLW